MLLHKFNAVMEHLLFSISNAYVNSNTTSISVKLRLCLRQRSIVTICLLNFGVVDENIQTTITITTTLIYINLVQIENIKEAVSMVKYTIDKVRFISMNNKDQTITFTYIQSFKLLESWSHIYQALYHSFGATPSGYNIFYSYKISVS